MNSTSTEPKRRKNRAAVIQLSIDSLWPASLCPIGDKLLDSSAAGFYAPVIITQGGEVFTFGASTASDGHQHVKLLGTNTFGFEDLLASQGSDWDFNDTKIRVSVT